MLQCMYYKCIGICYGYPIIVANIVLYKPVSGSGQDVVYNFEHMRSVVCNDNILSILIASYFHQTDLVLRQMYVK